MAGVYIDTSALGRVLLAEPDAAAIRSALGRYDSWWSSELLIVELRRLAAKANLVDPGERLLAAVSLHPLDRAVIESASRVDPVEVRSLDAIHLQSALELREEGAISVVVTYDQQLRRGCGRHALSVESP